MRVVSRALLAAALVAVPLVTATPASASCMEEVPGVCVRDLRDEVCALLCGR